MSRIDLFTHHANLLMHLSAIGSIGIHTHLSADIAFAEQLVQELTVDLVAMIDTETILMANESGFEIGAVDFERGQVVLVPAR